MRLTTLAALALLCIPRPAPAAGAACDGMTQADMNECAGQSLQGADAALNAAYRRLTARLATDTARRGLVEAQRAWIRFRDAECDFGTSINEGGSIRPMVIAGCMEGLTRQRTAELDAYTQCSEGECRVPLR